MGCGRRGLWSSGEGLGCGRALVASGDGLGLCGRRVSSATAALLMQDGTMAAYCCAETFSRSASAAADSLTEVKGRITSRWLNSSLAP